MRCGTFGTTKCFLNKFFNINNDEVHSYHIIKLGNYEYILVPIESPMRLLWITWPNDELALL